MYKGDCSMLRQSGLIIRCKSKDNVHVINHKLKKMPKIFCLYNISVMPKI